MLPVAVGLTEREGAVGDKDADSVRDSVDDREDVGLKDGGTVCVEGGVTECVRETVSVGGLVRVGVGNAVRDGVGRALDVGEGVRSSDSEGERVDGVGVGVRAEVNVAVWEAAPEGDAVAVPVPVRDRAGVVEGLWDRVGEVLGRRVGVAEEDKEGRDCVWAAVQVQELTRESEGDGDKVLGVGVGVRLGLAESSRETLKVTDVLP